MLIDELDEVVLVVGDAVAVVGGGQAVVERPAPAAVRPSAGGELDDGRAQRRVVGDGAGGDLEGVGGDLRAAEVVLIGQVVDQGAVDVGGDEDDVGDVVLVDELEELGAARRRSLRSGRRRRPGPRFWIGSGT